MQTNHVEEKVIEALEKHPSGMSITEIAKFVGLHRHNVTKYVYQLVGSGIISQRLVGPVKLCYLKRGRK